MTTEVPAPVAGAQVACPKCAETVLLPADVCPHCRKHLYVQCGECRAVNFRGDERCQECGAALKWVVRDARPRVDRQLWPFCWSSDRRRRWLVPAQMALFLASVGLATYAAITIAEYRRPRPNTEPPRVFVLEDGKLKPIEEVVKP